MARTPPDTTVSPGPSGLRAISLPNGQRSLSGSGIVVTLDRTDDFRVEGFRSNGNSGAMARAALQDLHAVAASNVGRTLAEVTSLIRTDTGIEAVATPADFGWDLHDNSADQTNGRRAQNLNALAEVLAAFARDPGSDMARVTVVP